MQGTTAPALSFSSASNVSVLGFTLTKLTKLTKYTYTWYGGLKRQRPSLYFNLTKLTKLTKHLYTWYGGL